MATNRPREPFNGPFAFTLSYSEKEREKKNAVFIQMYTDYALGKFPVCFCRLFALSYSVLVKKKEKLSNFVV